jgi:hypothetical protein
MHGKKGSLIDIRRLKAEIRCLLSPGNIFRETLLKERDFLTRAEFSAKAETYVYLLFRLKERGLLD